PLTDEKKMPQAMDRSSVDINAAFAIPTDSGNASSGKEFQKTFGRRSRAKFVALLAFCCLLVLSLAGIPLLYIAPFCAAMLFLFGAFDTKKQASKLPWDIFLLVVAG